MILSINGTPINGPDDFTARMFRMTIGTAVVFTLDHDGQSSAAALRLVSLAEAYPDGGFGDLLVRPQTASTGPQFGMKIRDFPPAERNARHFEGDEGIEVVSVDQDSFALERLNPRIAVANLERDRAGVKLGRGFRELCTDFYNS